MSLTEWLKSVGWTWQKLSHELSAVTRGNGNDYIHYHRIWQLRNAQGTPVREWEQSALMEVTNNEVDSFYDPVV